MLDTMVSYLWPEAMTQYTVVGHEASTADPTARPDLIFETADGYITAGTISDSEWRGFCAAAEQPDLAEDPRFTELLYPDPGADLDSPDAGFPEDEPV